MQTLDADGLLVLPGGVDTHCHIEQLRPNGGADEESFVTGSTACLAGGTTTVVTFAAQFKGHGILDTLAEYQRRGLVHFHAVIRLDAATECRCPGWAESNVTNSINPGIRSLPKRSSCSSNLLCWCSGW
jgi:cytosine/adenosine deaminase-related metal-dependent hydrolase